MHNTLWNPEISPDTEPNRIMIERGVFIDAARQNREVPWKIYYPADMNQACPVVIWSHGLGGTKDGGGYIHRFVASHGYVVVCIQHPGTDSTLWEGKQGHPWDAIRAAKIPRKASSSRFGDIPFVLNQLQDFGVVKPEIAKLMDLGRLAISGHSFGARTAQFMAGQMRGFGQRLYSLREKRFSCGILYSPVPSDNRRDPPQSIYGPITIPLFHMSGTADTSPIEGFGYKTRLEVFENSGGPEQSLLLLNDGDHMIYNGSRGQLGENPKRGVHETIIKVASLAYWDAYLKNDAVAKDWLTKGGFAAWMNGEGTYTFRP